MVEGMATVTVSTAERMATLGVPSPRPCVEIDGVLHDVALGHQVRRDVHGGVGDEQRLGMRRHVHDEDVADAAAGAQPGLALGDRGQQLVGVEAALHEQLGLALAHERDGLLGRRLAVRRVDDLDAGDIDAAGLRELPDLVGRANEYGNDQSGPIGLERAGERGLVAGMRHRRGQRRLGLGGLDQPLVFGVLTTLGEGGLFGHRCLRKVRDCAGAAALTTSGTW